MARQKAPPQPTKKPGSRRTADRPTAAAPTVRATGNTTNSNGAAAVPVRKTYKLFVGGKFPRSESGRYDLFALTDDRSVNFCRASRKDFRDAVVAARQAFPGWAAATAYNRGQVLYRIAEMLEGRALQFVHELQLEAQLSPERNVRAAIDRLVYYAGWCDKLQQVFSTVNPVASSHFNFSMIEPTGVVAIIAPCNQSVLGLVSVVAPVILSGNTCVVLAAEDAPLSAITFAEVLNTSDVPGGVVNLLTGRRAELLEQFAAHLDVNAVVYCGDSTAEIEKLRLAAANNVKRVVIHADMAWQDESAQNPYLALDTVEVKTTWHPVGR